MLLADTNSSLELGIWVASAAFILNSIINGIKLAKSIRNDPERISILGHCADKAEFDASVQQNRAEHENLFAKLGGLERGLRAEAKAESAQIHEKVNKVDREVGALANTTILQNQQLARMETKLDRIAERGGRHS